MPSLPTDVSKEETLLSSRFRDPDQRLFFAKASLFPNRIELSGFAFSGMYRRLILLKHIERVEWRVRQKNAPNITFWLRNGKKKQLWFNGAGLWKYMIEANVRNISRQLPARTNPKT